MPDHEAPPPSSFDGDPDFFNENRTQKLIRRIKEEPLIPLGMVLTCWAFFGATRASRAGDRHKTNVMFRRRIYAQAFTIVAMVAGSAYWQGDRKKRKEYEKLQEEKERAQRHEAWLRELEARDEEEKALKLKKERRAARDQAVSAKNPDVLAKSMLEAGDTRKLGIVAAVEELVRR